MPLFWNFRNPATSARYSARCELNTASSDERFALLEHKGLKISPFPRVKICQISLDRLAHFGTNRLFTQPNGLKSGPEQQGHILGSSTFWIIR
jgi:hypothetical protein